MKITGQILKENRERKGVTLNEVSLSTKITIKTLVAIEEGDPINLPPKTFLRGFVRSYAIFLGVDTEEILRTFAEEMGSTLSRPGNGDTTAAELNAAATEAVATGEASSDSVKAAPPFVERRAHPRTPTKKIDAEATLRDEPSLVTKGGIVAGILVLIVLIVVLKGKMDSYESERTKPTATPEAVETVAPEPDAALTAEESAAGADAAAGSSDVGDDGTNTVAAATAAAVLPATPSPTPLPTPSATPSPTPKPSATPTPTPKPTPSPSPSPTATPTPTPKPSPTPSPTPVTTASPTPSSVGAAPAGKSHEILIEALDGVDVEVTIDGEAARTIKLRGEQVQSIKVKRKAILKLSDGGAVNLIVNGVDRGVPGDLGKPTRVELP